MVINKMVCSLLAGFAMVAYMPLAQAHTQLHVSGSPAKRIYNHLTGPAVTSEGAAGHLYRQGKSVLCRYTDVDMNDSHGNPIPAYDPRRYACSIKFNKNGFATPGSNP